MLTRRDMLKLGLLTGAAALGPATRILAQTSTTNGVGITPIATQPFVEPLPIMPIKLARGTGLGCESYLTPGTLAGPFMQHVPYEGEMTAQGTYHQCLSLIHI